MLAVLFFGKLMKLLLVMTNYKQLLDEVFGISGIIKVSASVISLGLADTLIIPDITKTESNNCFIERCFEINNDK